MLDKYEWDVKKEEKFIKTYLRLACKQAIPVFIFFLWAYILSLGILWHPLTFARDLNPRVAIG